MRSSARLRILGLVLSLAFSARAQQPLPVVYQRVFTDRNAIGSPVTIRNIGQSTHRFTGTWTGALCTAPNENIGFQASFDGTNFFRIGAYTPFTNGTGFFPTTTATGTYPYVRINPQFFAVANCTLNGWYSGGFVSTPADDVAANVNAVFVSVAALGSTTVVVGGGTATRIAIYELDVWNGDATVTNTILLQDAAGTTYYRLRNFPPQTGYHLANTGRSHYTFLNEDSGFVVNLSAASAGVEVRVRFRYE